MYICIHVCYLWFWFLSCSFSIIYILFDLDVLPPEYQLIIINDWLLFPFYIWRLNYYLTSFFFPFFSFFSLTIEHASILQATASQNPIFFFLFFFYRVKIYKSCSDVKFSSLRAICKKHCRRLYIYINIYNGSSYSSTGVPYHNWI